MMIARGTALSPGDDLNKFQKRKLTISNLNANIDFIEVDQKQREQTLNIQGYHKKSEVRIIDLIQRK